MSEDLSAWSVLTPQAAWQFISSTNELQKILSSMKWNNHIIFILHLLNPNSSSIPTFKYNLYINMTYFLAHLKITNFDYNFKHSKSDFFLKYLHLNTFERVICKFPKVFALLSKIYRYNNSSKENVTSYWIVHRTLHELVAIYIFRQQIIQVMPIDLIVLAIKNSLQLSLNLINMDLSCFYFTFSVTLISKLLK